MKKILAFAMIFLCTACGVPENKPVPYVQEAEHLHINYAPVNYDNQVGMWFPYMHFEEYMYNKNADSFREAVREKFTSAKNQGVNTVYLHIHPCGDAYYKSDIFPSGVYLTGDYDPLQIMTEEAHAMGLSVHAWLNPLRCQTVAQMQSLPENFIIKQWADNPECNFVGTVNERYYLNPAYEEVINLICDGAEEIIERYDVDGIHIDDYFYPTTEEYFDREAFSASGNESLSAWRTENCTRLVKALYDTINKHGLVFGISPQGNVYANYSTQYADVNLWGSEDGYCDYIVPQIYYGFNNETCPFVPVLNEWEEITSGGNVKLIIGLGAYKLGQADKWAGVAGENEWLENPDIINQQIETVKNSTADGYALYY